MTSGGKSVAGTEGGRQARGQSRERILKEAWKSATVSEPGFEGEEEKGGEAEQRCLESKQKVRETKLDGRVCVVENQVEERRLGWVHETP